MHLSQLANCIRITAFVAFSLFFMTSCSKATMVAQSTEGFDFTYGGTIDEESWAGPQIGKSIDLTRLKDRNGTPLLGAGEHKFLMVAIVDPECAAAKAALDQLTGVREGIAKQGVPYYPISVIASKSEADFFTYADSLKLGTAYLWRKSEPEPPPELYSMVVPSHLLLTNDGTVVRKWPGTNRSEVIRARMVNQIVSDTLHELKRSRS